MHAAVLKRLVGIASRDHRLSQLPSEFFCPFYRLLRVLRQILSVQVNEIKARKERIGKARNVSRPLFHSPERMARAHQHRILPKQGEQLRKGQKTPLLLMRLQSPVQLQDGLRRPDGKDVAALRNIRLHARKNPQPVRHKSIPLPVTAVFDVAVNPVKSQRIEMLGQADGIQSRPFRLRKQPVRVNLGKRQLLRQLSVGVKIHFHSYLLPKRFTLRLARRISHSAHRICDASAQILVEKCAIERIFQPPLHY